MAGFLFLGVLLLLGCSQSAPSSLSIASGAEVSRFLAQLDSVKALPTDTAQSFALRQLFNTAPPPVRRATVKPVLKAASNLFFYHLDADTLLLPFYQHLSVDSSLLPVQRAKASQNLASFYAHIAGDADSASFYLSRATQDTAVLDDTLRATIASTQAQVYQLRNDLPAAAKELYRAIVLSERTHDSTTVAHSRVNLANVYRSMEDYESAITHRRRALAYLQTKGDDMAAFVAATGLVADFVEIGAYDSARRYRAQSDVLLAKGVQHPIAEYYLNMSLGMMYVGLQDYDSAIFYFDHAKPLLTQLQDPAKKLYFTLGSAQAYVHRKDMTAEEALIQQALPQLHADSDLKGLQMAYNGLYRIALAKPNKSSLPAALDYYLLYDSVRSILNAERNHVYIAEMGARYGAEKKDLTIQVQERELKRKTALNGVLLLSGISLVLAACGLFVQMRLRESRRKARLQDHFTAEMLKNTEAERGRIAMDLHDGIGHELLTLKNSLQQTQSATEARIDTILNNIRRMSRNLHPVMLDKIGLEHSIYALCEQINATGQLFVSAEVEYQKQLTPECELQLYRIIQESLSNTVRYAHAQAAKVSILLRDAHTLLVTIMDNGKGFDVDEKLASETSFGLHSIQGRSKVLGGKPSFHSGPQGTTITIEIPFT